MKTHLVLRLAVFGVNGHELCVFGVLISRRLDHPVNHLPNTQTCDQRAEIQQEIKDGKLCYCYHVTKLAVGTVIEKPNNTNGGVAHTRKEHLQ